MRLGSIVIGRGPVHILLLALTLVATFTTLTSVAQAANGWDVVAVRAPDNQLVFCRAELPDAKTNLTLAVALSAKDEVNIGIKVPGGDFTKGEGYDVTLSLDNDFSKKVTAESAMSELLLIRLGVNPGFLARLSKASVLRVVGDADATEFKLKGSSKAVEQLRLCVKDAGAAPQGTAAATTAEGFPLGLAALLQASGLVVKPVLLPDVPGRAVDYAWTTSVNKTEIEGGFRERAGESKALADIVTQELAPYKKECGAKNVQAGKVETLKTLALQDVAIACGKEHAAFLFYKTNTGIFALLVHRGDKAAATAARDKVGAVVRRLGKEEKQ